MRSRISSDGVAAGEGSDVLQWRSHDDSFAHLLSKERLLAVLRWSFWKILDLKTVVIVAPLAAGKYLLGDFLDRKIGIAIRLATEGRTQDERVRFVPTSSLSC